MSKQESILIHKVETESENTPNWVLQRHSVNEDLSLYRIGQDEDVRRSTRVRLPKGVIFFQFLEGSKAVLQFGPVYQQELEQAQSMLLYNPVKELDFTVSIEPGCRSAILLTTVSSLHHLLIDDSAAIPFLDAQAGERPHYVKSDLHPALRLTLEQLYGSRMRGVSEKLYLTAKSYELLAQYFHADEQKDFVERCPFLKDQRNVEAVRNARHIIVDRMSTPPTIKELSLEVGLNESQLKEGFKNIYGNTINGYLQEHRMNRAMKLLSEDGYMVQEAANDIGYSNVSHFISAFKKRYGETPKQYLKGN